MTINRNSLVLYKNHPAWVMKAGDRLEIALEGGRTRKVRPKDVVLLHPGPVQDLEDLQPLEGEIETAWELLAGDTTTLSDLAELIYNDYTPATAWATWQLVADGLYFNGTPDQITVCTSEEVAREEQNRANRIAEEQAWSGFLERLRAGQTAPEDDRFLAEVESHALDRSPKSRALRELGRAETPENAHALLLELGYWDHAVVPHLRRLDLPLSSPAVELPALPEEERTDLTHLAAFAIDDEGNQDPDDALSLEEGRLWVHVADVASLIPPESPADQEARARGSSLYLPEGTVSMLPPRAAHLLGLGLSEISPALSFGLDLNPEGAVKEVEVVPSWVRVERLTYAEVETRLAEEPFQSLNQLAQTMQGHRWANGAIFIEWPEVRVKVEEGRVRILPLPPLNSRDLVTEAMLMAGEAVARFAIQHQIPIPFATQDPPAEIEVPEGLAGMLARRRTLKPSQLRSVQAPHAGLGLEVYAQATSPLRRYMDLVVHQQIRAYVCGKEFLDAQTVLERVGTAEAISGSMRQAERLANRHWTLVYLMEHSGWRGAGILVDRRDRRGTVFISELGLEIPLHLQADWPLNSTIPLTLNGIDLARLEAHFRIEE